MLTLLGEGSHKASSAVHIVLIYQQLNVLLDIRHNDTYWQFANAVIAVLKNHPGSLEADGLQSTLCFMSTFKPTHQCSVIDIHNPADMKVPLWEGIGAEARLIISVKHYVNRYYNSLRRGGNVCVFCYIIQYLFSANSQMSHVQSLLSVAILVANIFRWM